ncbi:hypothetical protein A1359_03990 [Methylomonas lenta]|uniref:Uncharacterized protein n=1 Tax=Methylomonas lenta TaxID=980561 RepID=A0A177NQG9_9GAMM|nr:hypothetical protein A1359_03990 [Methylomonas lenta]
MFRQFFVWLPLFIGINQASKDKCWASLHSAQPTALNNESLFLQDDAERLKLHSHAGAWE